MRRALVKAAVSASRVPSTKTSMLGVASQFAVPSIARIATPIALRCFSQTSRVADFSSLEQQAEGQSNRFI